jgi:hypothetical protein
VGQAAAEAGTTGHSHGADHDHTTTEAGDHGATPRDHLRSADVDDHQGAPDHDDDRPADHLDHHAVDHHLIVQHDDAALDHVEHHHRAVATQRLQFERPAADDADGSGSRENR